MQNEIEKKKRIKGKRKSFYYHCNSEWNSGTTALDFFVSSWATSRKEQSTSIFPGKTTTKTFGEGWIYKFEYLIST
jgi:hypothetical protein